MAADELSIDEEIAADWAAIREKYQEEPAEPAVAEPSPEGSEPAAATPPETPERPRDESGRFAKQLATKVPPPERIGKDKQPAVIKPVDSRETPAQNPSGNAENGPSTEAGSTRDLTRAPSTWKPQAREAWNQLPEGVRAEIHRRETDFLSGQHQLLPDAQFGRSMRAVVDPYKMLIEAEGATPERAVGDIMKTAAILRIGTPDQKLNALLGAAQQFGVDLRSHFQAPNQGQPSGQPQTFQDPRVDQLLAHLRNQDVQRQQAEQSQLEQTVTAWMGETDAQGNPLRPYLNDVMAEMQGLVPQIRQAKPALSQQQVLQEAYERATWGNPDVRTVLQSQQQQQQQQQRDSENQNRLREARRAASVNVPRRASVPSPGKPGRMEDTIAETARTLGLIS